MCFAWWKATSRWAGSSHAFQPCVDLRSVRHEIRQSSLPVPHCLTMNAAKGNFENPVEFVEAVPASHPRAPSASTVELSVQPDPVGSSGSHAGLSSSSSHDS